MNSFSVDYKQAYWLLRTGSLERKWVDILIYNPDDDRLAREAVRTERIHKMGRIASVVYAFKLVKEMRRQRILMTVLFPDFNKPKQDLLVTNKKPLYLFPITINKTTVTVQKPKDEKTR